MQSFQEVWAKVLSYCKPKIADAAYDLWIMCIKPEHFDGTAVTLKVESPFQKEVIEKRYLPLLNEAFAETLGFDVEIDLDVMETEKTTSEDTLDEMLGESGEGKYTFDTFVVGPYNKFAHAASLSVAKNPSGAYNPLFIWGNSGLGKTHLLFAIKNEILTNTPSSNILYIKGEEFTNEVIQAIREQSTMQLKQKYRGVDVLLFDDVQFIGGKESTQEEFFHTFDALHQLGKQIILTSDRPPREIKTLEDRLRSRFESGLLADIQAPDFETRIAIISNKADQMDFFLSNEVIEYIASRLKTNVRQLEGAVKRLLAFKTIEGANPTIAVAQNAIRDIINESELSTPVTVDKVMTEVSRTYSVSPADMQSSKRSAQISMARKTAMYIVRETTQMSMAEIGKEFGDRDHSTVVYALQQVEKDMSQNSYYKETISDIIKNIKSHG